MAMQRIMANSTCVGDGDSNNNGNGDGDGNGDGGDNNNNSDSSSSGGDNDNSDGYRQQSNKSGYGNSNGNSNMATVVAAGLLMEQLWGGMPRHYCGRGCRMTVIAEMATITATVAAVAKIMVADDNDDRHRGGGMRTMPVAADRVRVQQRHLSSRGPTAACHCCHHQGWDGCQHWRCSCVPPPSLHCPLNLPSQLINRCGIRQPEGAGKGKGKDMGG